MVRKLRISVMNHESMRKFKKKFNKGNFGKLVISLFVLGVMVFFAQSNSPSNLVKRTLQDRYYAKVTDIHLERTGNNTYRLINAPTDPLSSVQLEHWRVEYFGMGFTAFVAPLDISADDEINRNVNIHLTSRHYLQLQALADEQGISLEQATRDMLLQELNRQ